MFHKPNIRALVISLATPLLLLFGSLAMRHLHPEPTHTPLTAEVHQPSVAPAHHTPSQQFATYVSTQQESSPSLTPSEQAAQDEADAKPLFENWDVPSVALFVSGRQHGYLEPCGCIGLDRQKGGMMRRHTLIKQLQANGWNLVTVDAGNQIRRVGRQSERKLTTTFDCLAGVMQYHVIGIGPDDLQIPTIDLMSAMINHGAGDVSVNPFVSANVAVFDPEIVVPYRIIESQGKRILVTTILGDEHLPGLPNSSDVTVRSVKETLDALIPILSKEACDLRVLVAQSEIKACRQIAQAYPFFDLLVTAGGAGDPTLLPEQIKSTSSNHVTQMIQVGVKGMYAGVVGIFDDNGKMTLRYQRVPLDSRFDDSEEIKAKFLNYQQQLQSLGLSGLGLSPAPHPSGRQFVGSEACADCHDRAYEIWKDGHDGNGGPHFRATADLTDPGERTWVQRHNDPECLSCHVTGWNPQKFFPYESGYLDLNHTHLHGNGCENCHGPGSHHVAAENGDIDVDETTRMGYVQEMILTLEMAKSTQCFECHDLDNSPDFHIEGAFEKYWEQIKHGEDD